MTEDAWLKRVVVLIIISVASLIALAIIGTAVIFPLVSVNAIPKVLENWGGLIIGFYFGTFVGMLKDWLSSGAREDGGGNGSVEGGRGHDQHKNAQKSEQQDQVLRGREAEPQPDREGNAEVLKKEEDAT